MKTLLQSLFVSAALASILPGPAAAMIPNGGRLSASADAWAPPDTSTLSDCTYVQVCTLEGLRWLVCRNDPVTRIRVFLSSQIQSPRCVLMSATRSRFSPRDVSAGASA